MKLILVVTIAVGVSGGLLAWRERPQPGAVPLAFLLAGQAWWSATLFFRITATEMSEKIFWVDVSWIGIGIIPVAWLLFSLEYTGYSQYVKPRFIALLLIVPLITAVLGLTDGYHGLLYTDSMLVDQNGVSILDRSPGIWFWVIAGYTYLLGLIGAFPLLLFITSQVNTFRGQSLLLLGGLIVPWATNVLFVLDGLPTAGIDPTPIAFSITGVAYLSALTQYQLFGTNPTPIRQARRTVFNQMQEGAMVLDQHDNVVEVNKRAAAILEVDPSTVLGRPITTVLPNLAVALDDQSQGGQTVLRPNDGVGGYDISVNQLVDDRDRGIGRIVTLHDISDHLRQQQRLEVLHRVFRHNLRTNMQVILGTVDTLDEYDETQAAHVRQSASEINQLSENILTVLDIFKQQRTPTQTVSLRSLLDDSIATVRTNYPETTVHSDIDSAEQCVDSVFSEVIFNVLENAAEHNTSPDPWIQVSVDADDESARIVVTDNGPGIDDQELALIQDGVETPLKHGSGFGLALIVWGTEIAGGAVSFEENDPTGTTVIIEVPVLADTEASSEVSPSDERNLFGASG
ncbi:PAS domain-containing protein [Natronolimnobius sp. AArcel1]|uniref:histidine kinase N-terminal 7TM domain-containing protein n=1 Tax=Natronolimnobius sp. AArcel1 TaxID=1679093 RepID=UPI0013EBB623|nr:histidine kinase N-terminal 7TM domain-containing protein [Natronolimnobius sp. AArcel1]NGM70774.1 PAS domain-containing protein [Natronolimnobius sp. AArcel1]